MTDYDRLIEEAMNSNPTRLSYMRQGFSNEDQNPSHESSRHSESEITSIQPAVNSLKKSFQEPKPQAGR